ncbi:MAG: glycosyltransferase [Clostridia bacterium]|nr:glycosyltransferase [Clostridia bacterium]
MEVKQKIKIAQVVGASNVGGVISCVLNFYRNVDRDIFQFDFYTYGPSRHDKEILDLGGRVFYIPNVLSFFKSVSAMKSHFKKENYYAVHAHLTSLSFVPLFAAKRAGVKNRICHAHSTSHKSEKVWIVKNTLKHISKLYPTRLAGCSKLSNRWLYGKKKGEEAFLLRNAIDLNRFYPDGERRARMKEKLGLSGKNVIGCVGRFEFQKNIPFLIDAFALLAKSNENAHLVLVGGGSEEEAINKKIERYGLSERVHILRETQSVENYFAAFDLFVLPSRFEGLPLVAVEAQAMGIPCLLSDLITDEVNITGKCQFISIDSPRIWAEKMNNMLHTATFYDETAKIKNAGYDIKLESKRLENFYQSLNGGK